MASLVTVPSLLDLFRVDRDIYELQTALEALLQDQLAVEAKIKEIEIHLAGQHAAGQKLQADIATQELDMQARQQHIEKMRETLNNTKTNKEYSAILVQISADKAELSKVETIMLQQMQQLEEVNKALAATRENLALQNQLLQKAQNENADRAADLRNKIEDLQVRRTDCAGRVPPEALRQYDRLRQKYPGDALAPVEFDESDLENISCGGCYMGLNIEDVNLLRGRDEIRRCNACNRILYLPEMLTPEQAKADHAA